MSAAFLRRADGQPAAGEAAHHLPPTTTTRLYAQNTRGGTLPFLVAALFASYSLLLTEMRCDSGEEAWRGLFLCPPAEFAHAGGLLKITSPHAVPFGGTSWPFPGLLLMCLPNFFV